MISKLWLLLIFVSLEVCASYGYKLNTYEAEMPGHFFLKADSRILAISKAQAASKRHVSFLIGSLMIDETNGKRGAISNNFQVSNIRVTEDSIGTFRVDYKYKGQLILENKKDLTNFSTPLPLYPEELFAEANNKCTRSFYYVGAEFVYFQFWNPTRPNCPQVEGKDYIKYPITLTLVPETKESYPRYEEMIVNNEVSFYYYFGSDYENMRKFGESGVSYENLRYWLKNKKFKKVSDPDYSRTSSSFTRMEKIVGNTKITFKLMLGNPLPNTPTAQEEYFWFMKDAIENGNFIQYTGHAGHGGIMDLTSLSEKFKSEVKFPDRYQVFYLNGCQTYIYATEYFARMKGGYKNLHLMGNGDYSWTDVTWESLVTPLESFYNYFSNGQRLSYQNMINTTSINMEKKLLPKRSGPMLTVVGDE